MQNTHQSGSDFVFQQLVFSSLVLRVYKLTELLLYALNPFDKKLNSVRDMCSSMTVSRPKFTSKKKKTCRTQEVRVEFFVVVLFIYFFLGGEFLFL